MNIWLKWIILTLLLCFSFINTSVTDQLNRYEFITYHYDYLGTIKEYIRRHEGLRLKPYNCPAGYKTIGYGHLCTKPVNGSITLEQAEELLHADLMKANQVVMNYPLKEQWAYTHFIYCLGSGSFKKAKFKHSKRKSDLLKWCKYRKDGKLVACNYLKSMREAEWNIIQGTFPIKKTLARYTLTN